MHPAPDHSAHLFDAATFGAGVWSAIDLLWRYGPSWSVVPPLVLSVAALTNALANYRRAARGK